MKPSRRRCKFGAAGSLGPPGIKARPCLWHGATEAGNNEKLRPLPSTIRTCLDVRHLLRWQMERRQVHVRFAHERGNQMTDAGARDSDLLKCNGCSQPFVKGRGGRHEHGGTARRRMRRHSWKHADQPLMDLHVYYSCETLVCALVATMRLDRIYAAVMLLWNKQRMPP